MSVSFDVLQLALSSDRSKANVSSSASSILSEPKSSKYILTFSVKEHDLRKTLTKDHEAVKQNMRDTSDTG